MSYRVILYFFFKDPATTAIYTLSLHDALPICPDRVADPDGGLEQELTRVDPRLRQHVDGPRLQDLEQHPGARPGQGRADRKSTRLNSSHVRISYAVFCLKKKNNFDTVHKRKLY